jgi:membrane protein
MQTPTRSTLAWLLQIAYTTARLFTRNGMQNHAAATAFYFLLSATPLVLLMSYALQWLAHLAENSRPATILMAALYAQLHLDALGALGFLPGKTRLTAGSVSFFTLLLSSRGLVTAVQNAFRVIFPNERRRGLVVSWTLPFVILPLLFLLMLLSALAQATLDFLAQNQLIGHANAALLGSLNGLLGFLVIGGLIFVAYWRLPERRPGARAAALFALGATLSLIALFAVFRAFFKLENYNGIYGALGSVVFVLIGAYLAFLIFYVWAQALYAYGKSDVTALEKLFLASHGAGATRLESYVFADTNRLLEKYGRVFVAGETIIREGDTTQTTYFLYAGRAAVYKDGPDGARRIGTLEEGELFGEMAYLLGERRTASVIAETDVTVLELPPATFEELMRSSAPLARRVVDVLCQRLERMNLASAGQTGA